MKQTGLWIIFTLVIFGCNKSDDKAIEQKLTDCYKERFYDNDGNLSDPIPYYEKLERFLIQKNYLKGKTKKDYLELWDNLYDSAKDYSIMEFAKENGMIVVLSNLTRSKYCFYSLVVDQHVTDNQINSCYLLIEKMDKIGNYQDLKLNKEFIETIDEDRFEKIVFRIPTLTYVYHEIETREKNYGRQHQL